MFSIFELLVETVALFRTNLWLYLGYAAWLLVPFAAFLLLSLAPEHWLLDVADVLVSVAELFLALWISLIFIKLTAALVLKHPVDPQVIQKEALALIPAAVRILALQLIIFLGGLILFIIPGVIFGLWYTFSQQVLVLDGKQGLEALAASKELVKGRFLSVLWRLLGGTVIITIIYSMAVGGAILLVEMINGTDINSLFQNDIPMWAQTMDIVGELFFVPLIAIYIALLFLHLRQVPVEKPQGVA